MNNHVPLRWIVCASLTPPNCFVWNLVMRINHASVIGCLAAQPQRLSPVSCTICPYFFGVGGKCMVVCKPPNFSLFVLRQHVPLRTNSGLAATNSFQEAPFVQMKKIYIGRMGLYFSLTEQVLSRSVRQYWCINQFRGTGRDQFFLKWLKLTWCMKANTINKELLDSTFGDVYQSNLL